MRKLPEPLQRKSIHLTPTQWAGMQDVCGRGKVAEGFREAVEEYIAKKRRKAAKVFNTTWGEHG